MVQRIKIKPLQCTSKQANQPQSGKRSIAFHITMYVHYCFERGEGDLGLKISTTCQEDLFARQLGNEGDLLGHILWGGMCVVVCTFTWVWLLLYSGGFTHINTCVHSCKIISKAILFDNHGDFKQLMKKRMLNCITILT